MHILEELNGIFPKKGVIEVELASENVIPSGNIQPLQDVA